MLKFDAKDSFELVGGGLVFTGPSPIDAGNRGELLKGASVEIWDVQYRVIGVETFVVDRDLLEGQPVGLLVARVH